MPGRQRLELDREVDPTVAPTRRRARSMDLEGETSIDARNTLVALAIEGVLRSVLERQGPTIALRGRVPPAVELPADSPRLAVQLPGTGEVGVHLERQAQRHRPAAVVGDIDVLVNATADVARHAQLDGVLVESTASAVAVAGRRSRADRCSSRAKSAARRWRAPPSAAPPRRPTSDIATAGGSGTRRGRARRPRESNHRRRSRRRFGPG